MYGTDSHCFHLRDLAGGWCRQGGWVRKHGQGGSGDLRAKAHIVSGDWPRNYLRKEHSGGEGTARAGVLRQR